MPFWAVIPIKPLNRGKSRLAGLITPEERAYLNQELLLQTISCLRGIPNIVEIAVISHDPNALHLSREMGVRTIQEARNTNINKALRKASEAFHAFGAENLLILPADLPLVKPDDINGLLSCSQGEGEMIISPDRRMSGTNALFVNPIGILDYEFGLWSFKKHLEQAERKKIRIKIYNNERIAFDLDIPEDLEELRKQGVLSTIRTKTDNNFRGGKNAE